MEIKNKVLKYLLDMDYFIAGISLIMLIGTTFMGVLMRYFFNNPYTWLEEFQLWCFVWLVFFGSGAAFRSGSHVSIDVVVDLMPPIARKIVGVFGYIVVMFILAYIMFHGSNLVKQLLDTGRYTNILKVPYPVIYSALPIGCVLMMINHTIVTALLFFTEKVETEGTEEEWI
ncbi:Tripartite ATP-independent periplasmic transporter, DctQ component [Alkaliphilus metalliredigens QYMF]|uniref:Tripartite ATP-independent periplasmic transporter, DctQ component n=1 Tax=Alkaliphilus metalliredigens (strain QYMF) TaxID=293826 RepID=A6TKR0_ALKMQ|nr:TRAP transporter small permease [Alkaliphilus metalliredigens]ABR46778.1 Tripartite ATP-independent periplasmic transporter, DctQ component [Alkaliphilus metalliredigens QYMF]